MIFCRLRQNSQYLFNMSYLEVFVVLTGVGVDVSKFFGVGPRVLKHGAGAKSESENCDSAHLCNIVLWPGCEGGARYNLNKNNVQKTCSSLHKRGDVVATSRLAMHWKCGFRMTSDEHVGLLSSDGVSRRVSRPVFWSLGLEGPRSRLGLSLEGFRSQSWALRLETLHRLFFMKFCKKEFLKKRV